MTKLEKSKVEDCLEDSVWISLAYDKCKNIRPEKTTMTVDYEYFTEIEGLIEDLQDNIRLLLEDEDE